MTACGASWLADFRVSPGREAEAPRQRSTALPNPSHTRLEARSRVARTVNTAMVHAHWLIGREIVEVEQHGAERAATAKA
jgi:hypothetical protein